MKPHEQVQFEMMKDQCEKLAPGILGAYPVLANLLFSYFTELKKSGFSDEQSLYIVTHQGYAAGTDGRK